MGSTGYTLLAERRLRKNLEEVMFLYAQYMIEKYPGARQIRERSNGLVKPCAYAKTMTKLCSQLMCSQS